MVYIYILFPIHKIFKLVQRIQATRKIRQVFDVFDQDCDGYIKWIKRVLDPLISQVYLPLGTELRDA